ncbi:TipJ family phage tail tip protein [Acinetobacter dispersus]|uniref:Fibronectin type-III domain-containing protein n=1 Tax=Acinetobacter dispersus TaxID=70348 RepID=N9MHI0_9GAMM|nr:phage tail protein [Acinetobacter dispersus]ENW92740.1 hypothetical protein F904_02683 [Acinetobacter dispersus]
MTTVVKGEKKGSKKARKPKIAHDSAQSITYIKLLYGLSEGEIEGLVDGYQSIFLEGTPLLDSNKKENFSGIKVDFRSGTNDQDYIEGFPDVRNEFPIDVELTDKTPWVRAIKNLDLDAVNIRFKWGPIFNQNMSNGDVNGYTIHYALDVQTDGGSWTEVLRTSLSGKLAANFQRQHRIDLPKADKGWQVRVRRITPNRNADDIGDKMYIAAYGEVIDVKLRYPNTALLGLQYDAETFGNAAKLGAECKGRIVKVPSNYNAVGRTYNGIWDGTFIESYTNNPAWIYYDICLSDRFGLGDRLKPFMIDKWSIYRLAQYCDQKVPDGTGREEPRFTCNVYLQTSEDAYSILSKLAGLFRAISYWDGNSIVCDADIPQDTYFAYSRSNVIEGHFEYSGTRARDRHNVVKVAWDNPANHYKTEYEYVRDEKAIANLGQVRILDLEAWGCTSRGQAQRAGQWALKSEQLETRTVTFKVGLDGHLPAPGRVIEVSDELFAGRANGGRVSAISKDLKSVTLDRDNVEVKRGDKLVVNGEDGKAQTRIVQSANGRVVTVTEAFKNIAVQNVWVVDAKDLATMKFRVISIVPEDKHQFTITGLQYSPAKFEAIDNATHIEDVPITNINPHRQDPVANVKLSQQGRVDQGITINTLVISWDQAKGAVKYLCEWRKDEGTWIRLPITGSNSVEVPGVYAGKYQARVTAISAFELSSILTYSDIKDLTGKEGLPPKLATLSATGVLFGMRLDWSFPKTGALDTAYTEIEVSPDGKSNISQLGLFAYPTTTHTIQGLKGNLTQNYRGRLIDRIGNVGEWSEWSEGITSNDAEEIIEIIQGQIGLPELNKDVQEAIEQASEEAKNAAKEAKEANDKATKESIDRADAIAAQSKIINEEMSREKKATADRFVKESRDRSLEINSAATKEANNRVNAIKIETDARLRDVKNLQDGINKETQERKNEAANILKTVETLKNSTENTLASVQKQIETNTTEISANAKKTENIDSRLRVADKTANDANAAAANAQRTANTSASRADANASQINSVNASLKTATEIADNAALLSKYQNGGKPMSDDPSFMKGNGGLGIYNNGAMNGSFVRSLKQSDNPTSSTHEMVRTTVNVMGTGIGWFFHPMVAAANRVYLIKQIVKLPVGFKLDLRSNSIGSGGNSLRWLSSNLGTGKYETYWSIAICGVNGPFSTTGHIALTALPGTPSPTPENPLKAYVALYEWWDCTAVNDTIPKRWRDDVEANALATSGLESRVTDTEGEIKSQSKAFEQLKNDLNVTNNKLDKKAESTALSQTNSTVKKQGDELTAHSGKLDSLSAAISSSTPEFRFTANIDSLNNLKSVHSTGKQRVSLIDEPTAVTGKVLRVGANSGEDSIILISETYLAIDPEKLYRIRYRFRRVQGEGSTWLSLVCSNADKSANITATNANVSLWDISNSNYFASNMLPKLGDWQTGEVFAKGKSLGGVSGAWSKQSPRSFPAKSAFFRLGILPNYPLKPGIQDFDYVVIEDYDAMAANESTSEIIKVVETNVKDVAGKVETNSNSIARITGQVKGLEDGIKKKADTEILKAYSTKTETNQAIANGIESFSAALNIGGQNILSNGDIVQNYTRWGTSNGLVSHLEEPGVRTRIARITFTVDSQAQGIVTNDSTMNIRAGLKYVASFLARASEGLPIITAYNYILGTSVANQAIGRVDITAGEWKRYEIAFTALRTGNFQLLLGSNSSATKGRYIDYAELQVQEGTKATEWTKPLSTFENSLDANTQAIQNTQAEVKNVDGKVSAQATQLNALKGEINSVDTKAAQAIRNAATAQSTANTAVSDNAVNAKNIAELDASLKNMSIGGQNLWSVVEKPLINEHGIGSKTIINKQDEHYRITIKSFSPANSLILSRHDSALEDTKHNIEIGQDYVYSFEIRANKPGLIHTIYAYFGSMRSVVTSNHKIGEEWTKFSFPFKTTGTGISSTNQLQGFAFSSNPNHGWAVDDWYEVRYVQMQKGNKATDYSKATGSIIKELDANAKAIDSTNADVKKLDQDVTTQSGKITSLENGLSTTNGEIKKKVDSAAVNAINSEVKKLGEGMSSQANSILKLEASYSSRDSDSLLPDYNLANSDCWTSHYGHDLAPFFKKTGSGKVTNTVVRKQAGDSSIFFNYSKSPLPLDKAYKVSFWVRRSADSDGLLYINGMYGKKNGTFSPASYYTNLIPVNSVPANEVWTYIERLVDLRALIDTNPQIKFGYGLGHTGTKGWWELQGYSVKAVLSEGDVDNTLATAKALNETNSAVKKTENSIESLSKSTSILQNDLSVSGKGGSNLLIKSNVTGTYNGVSYPHLRYELGEDWEEGATYTLIWCAEHARGAGDTNSYLAVYAGGGSQTVDSFAVVGKNVRKITFVKNATKHTHVLNFYMINKPTADKKSVGTVYWAVLVKGNVITTDQWIPSVYDHLPDINAAATAIKNVETQVIAVDSKVEISNKSTEQLKGRVDTVENGLKTKVESSTLVNYFTKAEAEKAIAGKVESYDASLKIGGVNVIADSEGEKQSKAASNREYFMYERSKELQAFYDENLNQPVTISFEMSVPVAGGVQVYSSNQSAHTFSTGVSAKEANKFFKYVVTVNPVRHPTTPNNTSGSTIEFYGTYNTGRIPTIRKLQIEAGSKATAWSPSPRDAAAAIDAQAKVISDTKAEVRKVDDKLTAQTKQVNDLKSQLDTSSANITNNYYTKAQANSAIAAASTTLESKIDKKTDEKIELVQGKTNVLDLTKLDVNTYYPVTISLDAGPRKRYKFTLIRPLYAFSDNPVPWATHSTKTFSVEMTWETGANAWGANVEDRKIQSFSFLWSAQSPVLGPTQMSRSSEEVIYLRGGARYDLICDAVLTPVVRTASYTNREITVSPTPYNAGMVPISDVANLSVRLNEQAQVIDGVKAIKGVSIDNNGVMCGYALTSELVNGVVRSNFGIDVDTFYVGPPSQGKKFFSIVNGTTHINDAIIGTLNASKVTVGQMHGDRIAARTLRADHLNAAAIEAIAVSARNITITAPDGSRTVQTGGLTEVFYPHGQIGIRFGVR